jgi:hypothetical protein
VREDGKGPALTAEPVAKTIGAAKVWSPAYVGELVRQVPWLAAHPPVGGR